MSEDFTGFEHAGWEHSVDEYDRSFGPLTSGVIPEVLNALQLGRESRLLDIASGPGYLAKAARERNAWVVALDFSARMCALAKGAGIDTIEADAQRLPIRSGSMTAAAMNFGMLHLADPDRAAAEASRVLEPGGRFAFTVWALPERAKGFELVLSAAQAHGDPTVEIPAGPPFFELSDSIKAFELLTRAGFREPHLAEVHLAWRLESGTQLFEAFLRGTARTGGLLRAQPATNLHRIRRAVEEEGARLFGVPGGLEVPMPALVYSGIKA